jgi:hypothetical protein
MILTMGLIKEFYLNNFTEEEVEKIAEENYIIFQQSYEEYEEYEEYRLSLNYEKDYSGTT